MSFTAYYIEYGTPATVQLKQSYPILYILL